MTPAKVADSRALEIMVGAVLAAVFFYFIFGDLVGLRENPPEVAVRADVFTVVPPGN